MDEAEAAADLAVQLVENRIARARRTQGPEYTGACYNCGDPLPEGQRWCNGACRDDWARRQ